MRRRGPFRMNLVETLIVLAILGIVSSLARSPSGSHRPPQTGPATSARFPREGQHNTIEAPDSRRQRSPEAIPVPNRALRGLLRTLLSIGVFALVPLFLRYWGRRRRSPRRPPQHQHPPDADE